MISSYLLSQALMVISIAIDIYAFSNKSREGILKFFAIAGSVTTIHFFLLSQWTAAGLSLLTVLRLFVASRSPSITKLSFFLLAQTLILFLTYRTWINLIGYLGSTLGIISSFQKDHMKLRIIVLFASILWLIHNILVKTPMGALAEAIFISANLIGLMRLGRAKITAG